MEKQIIAGKLASIYASHRVCSFFLILIFSAIPPAIAQQVGTVSGQVTTNDKARPLIGAFVHVEGSAIETVSGAGGRFILRDVPSGPQTLIVSYMGLPSFREYLTVDPGDSVHRVVQLGAGPDAMEHVIVTGNATGRARALNMQRAAANIIDIISADSIGNFPDQNVAEALGRVPGISIVRNRGEGRYVTIRGIDAELNAYSIDGLALAAPRADERAIALDIIPADVVERLEVSKTLLPDQPADAIGGAVNVVSQSAFDSGGPVARVTLQSNYYDSQGESEPHVNGAFGKVFGEQKQLGVLLAFSLDQRKFGVQGQSTRLWELEQDPITSDAFYLPKRIQQIDYDIDRKRQGTTVNLEYRPNDDGLYFLRGAYNEFDDHGIHHRTYIELDAAGLESLSNRSAIVNVGDVDEFGETNITQQITDRKEKLKIYAISAGGENWAGGFHMDYQLGYSYAEEDNLYRFRSNYLLADVTQIAYTGATALKQDINYTGVGVDPRDPANYVFDDASDRPFVVEEDHWEMAFNLQRELETANPSFLKSGFRVRLKDKKSENEEFESNANPATIDTLDQITAGTGSQTFNGAIPLVSGHIRQIFNQQSDEFDLERSFSDSTAGDWQSTEDIYALYLMGGYSLGNLDLQGGVRFERTEFKTQGYFVDEEAGTAEPNTAANNYNDWLPGIHAEYSFSDDSILRAAYAQTVSRPGFEQSSSATVTDGDEIERGNPDLNRALSYNYDLSWDYYLTDSLGMVSVSGFYKDVEDVMFSRVFEQEIGGELFEVTSYDNGDSGHIYGVEFAYQQEFSFLPAPFDGLGLQANMVFVDSETTLPLTEDRASRQDRKIKFPRQSDRVGNLALTYEQRGLFVRVAASYQDEYLAEVGDVPAEDKIAEEHFQWDISSRYTFSDRWTIFANFANITDEPEGIRYRGSNRTENMNASPGLPKSVLISSCETPPQITSQKDFMTMSLDSGEDSAYEEEFHAIRVHKVCKTYEGADAPVLHDVSFEVDRGEIFTLLGPSGCGKTTTLRLIAGLDTADSGNIHFGSEIVTARGVHVPPDRRELGMVFQSGAVWPHMTVQENVAFPLKARRVKRTEANRRVALMLELVGLQGLEDRPATHLSGGQQQRVALARALVTEPKVLLLDEPFNSLDALLREQMRADIKRLQRRLNVTVLFVTHDQSEALSLSDRVGLMRYGVLQQYGSPQQLYECPANEFVRNFLGKSVLLRGTRRKIGTNGSYSVALDGGRDAIIHAGASPPPSHRLVVALRPEDLEVITQRESQAQPPGTLAGTVRVVQFGGDRMEYQIEVNEQGLVEAYGGRHSVASEGQLIWLRPRAAGYSMWPLDSQ